MSGRERFRCTRCGIRLEGKVRDGKVYAYDRAPASADAKEQPVICAACADWLVGPEPNTAGKQIA